jgi:hypothetical protein
LYDRHIMITRFNGPGGLAKELKLKCDLIILSIVINTISSRQDL